MYRKTYVEIDCNRLENNIKEIKEKYNDYKYYIGVVKANCYGHGIESIKYLIKGGINYLAVSSLEEALNIRKIDKNISILILEPIHNEDVTIASDNNITITIDNKESFKYLIDNKIKIKFHIKVDTGMNRFGLKNKTDIKYIYDNSNKDVYLEGIFTQLAVGFGNEFIKSKEKFLELTSLIDINKIEIVHLERSLTLEQHDRLEFGNGIRLGIIMYGFNNKGYTPSLKRRIFNKLTFKKTNNTKSILNLNTVLKFYSEIIEIKDISKDEIVGYGSMYDNKENIKIGIIPYGFADYLFINKSYVVINGTKYNIVVNYMDATAIIIDDNVKLYDKVEIFGNSISIREASRLAGVNVYKTLCSITKRVPRIYKYNDKEKEINY